MDDDLSNLLREAFEFIVQLERHLSQDRVAFFMAALKKCLDRRINRKDVTHHLMRNEAGQLYFQTPERTHIVQELFQGSSWCDPVTSLAQPLLIARSSY